MGFRNGIGCFVCSIGPGGIISGSHQCPTSEGKYFLDYCVDDTSRERWREAYKTCYAMREPQEEVRVTVRLDTGHVVNLSTDFVWHGGDQVMVYMQREWPTDLLTDREQECLQLMAAQISPKWIAAIMDTTPDNARATMSRVKKKLNLVSDNGVIVAACWFRDQEEYRPAGE